MHESRTAQRRGLSKTQDWDEDDVEKGIFNRVTPNGTYCNDLVVHVVCSICGALLIGSSREAGGFLGGHGRLHAWEFGQVMGRDDGLTQCPKELHHIIQVGRNLHRNHGRQTLLQQPHRSGFIALHHHAAFGRCEGASGCLAVRGA